VNPLRAAAQCRCVNLWDSTAGRCALRGRSWAAAGTHRPAAGVVSGGPNSFLQDLAGCAPQRCWADEIEAYSVNERAISWNAPLAWVAAGLDEAARRQGRP
jgi:hypothetical protein